MVQVWINWNRNSQSSLELVRSLEDKTRVAISIDQTPLVHDIVGTDCDQGGLCSVCGVCVWYVWCVCVLGLRGWKGKRGLCARVQFTYFRRKWQDLLNSVHIVLYSCKLHPRLAEPVCVV